MSSVGLCKLNAPEMHSKLSSTSESWRPRLRRACWGVWESIYGRGHQLKKMTINLVPPAPLKSVTGPSWTVLQPVWNAGVVRDVPKWSQFFSASAIFAMLRTWSLDPLRMDARWSKKSHTIAWYQYHYCCYIMCVNNILLIYIIDTQKKNIDSKHRRFLLSQ